jgi:hypothetical protein
MHEIAVNLLIQEKDIITAALPLQAVRGHWILMA